MIKATNASFYFSAEKYLFREMTFEIEKGKILSILGPNGVGKTTLLKCIMGFKKLVEGSIYLNQISIERMGKKDYWSFVSYVPQAKNIVFPYSVLDMVLMGRAGKIDFFSVPKEEDIESAYEILKKLGLHDIAKKSCQQLSGGQLQMVLIARALVKTPQLLIMDEPETSLDIKNQLKILDLIERLKHEFEITTIINTHYPNHAVRISDYILMLGYQCEYIFGEAAKVITKDNLSRFFEVEAKIISWEEKERSFRSIFPMILTEART